MYIQNTSLAFGSVLFKTHAGPLQEDPNNFSHAVLYGPEIIEDGEPVIRLERAVPGTKRVVLDNDSKAARMFNELCTKADEKGLSVESLLAPALTTLYEEATANAKKWADAMKTQGAGDNLTEFMFGKLKKLKRRHSFPERVERAVFMANSYLTKLLTTDGIIHIIKKKDLVTGKGCYRLHAPWDWTPPPRKG